MGETFYSVLGVAATADEKAIRDAFRSRVKESHPDVSDDPDAPREFKRLTTARDVLTDEDERARYDRLGHTTYVARHVETSAWSVDAEGGQRSNGTGTTGGQNRDSTTRPGSQRTSGQSAGDGSGSGSRRHSRSDVRGSDRSAWLGEDWDGPRERRHRDQSRERRERRHHGKPGWSRRHRAAAEGRPPNDAADRAHPNRGPGRSHESAERNGSGTSSGSDQQATASGQPGTTSGRPASGATRTNGGKQVTGGTDQTDGGLSASAAGTWQHASAAYQYSPSAVPRDSNPTLRGIRRNLRLVAPWVVVHAVLFVGSLAMAWYMYAGTGGADSFSVPAVTFGLMLVGLVVFLSILHLVSMVYT